MKKSIICGLVASIVLLSCCTTNKGIVMNEVEAPHLPELMVCPAPGQDYNSLFTDADETIETSVTYLEVTLDQEGAKVFLNNQFIGEGNLKITNVPSGAYILDIIKEGYEDYSIMINVNQNKAYKFSVTLVPENE